MNKPRIETVDPGFFIRFSTGQTPKTGQFDRKTDNNHPFLPRKLFGTRFVYSIVSA